MKSVHHLKDLGFIPYKARRNNSVLNDEDYMILDKYRFRGLDTIDFKKFKKIDLEIGFGSGEFMLSRAKANPEYLYIGCEVYKPGVKRAARWAFSQGLANILIYVGDCREFLSVLSNFTFHDIFILFPDPWPKTRHHKRRLINHDFLRILSYFFKNKLHFATDFLDYARFFQSQISFCKEIKLHSFITRREPFFNTKFENKSLSRGGKVFHYICNNALSH